MVIYRVEDQYGRQHGCAGDHSTACGLKNMLQSEEQGERRFYVVTDRVVYGVPA